LKATQWIGIALMILLVGGLVFAFVRHGITIKSDAENKPDNPNAS
jgi:hypothetical protein